MDIETVLSRFQTLADDLAVRTPPPAFGFANEDRDSGRVEGYEAAANDIKKMIGKVRKEMTKKAATVA